MNTKKQANEFIQPGFFPGNFGNEPKFDTREYEDDNMFTGVEEGPYGDGSRLSDKDKRPEFKKEPVKKHRWLTPEDLKKYIVSPDGTIRAVKPPDSEENKMFDYKAKINYILSRLAAAAEGATAGKGPKETLMEILGINEEQMSPEMIKVTMDGLKKNLPDFKTENIIKVIEEISVMSQQAEANAAVTQGILDEYNKSLDQDKLYFDSLKSATKTVANDLLRSTIDKTSDLLVKMSIFPLIVKKCVKSFEYLDPKSGKCLFKAKSKMGIKGPAVPTELNLKQLEEGAKAATALVKFAEKNKKEIKEVNSAIGSAMESVKKSASKVPEAQKKIIVVFKKMSDSANARKKAFVDAYNDFRTVAKGYEERFPELQSMVKKAEKSASDVESLAAKATSDPANTIESLTELLAKMETAGAELKTTVDQAQQLIAGEKAFEATKETVEPAPEAPAPAAEAPAVSEAEALPEAESSQSGELARIAAASFESVVSKLNAMDSDDVWGDSVSALQSLNEDLESLVKEGEKMDAEITKKTDHLNALVQKASGADEGAESIMDEMSEKMEGSEAPVEEPAMEPEMAFASEEKGLEKTADATKVEVEPREYMEKYKKTLEELKGKTPKGVVEESEKAIGSWKEALAPYMPTMGYFTMFSVACEDFLKSAVEPAIIEIPENEAKSALKEFEQACREELVKRQSTIAADPELSKILGFQERETTTEESKKSASVADLFSQFVKELKNLKTETGDKLADLFGKDKNIQLFMAQVVKGSKVTIDVGLERRPSKEGPISFDEVATLMSDTGEAVIGHLNKQISDPKMDEGKKRVLEATKNKIISLDRAIKKAQADASAESRTAVAEAVKDLIGIYKQSKEKFHATDLNTQAFMDMLEDIAAGGQESVATLAPFHTLFVTAEDSSEGLSPQDAAALWADSIWPDLETIYTSYGSAFDLAIDNFMEAAESISTEEPEAAPVGEPELAFAADSNPDVIKRKAISDIVAPISPNDMYSSYDLSENSWELREENGTKKLVINKDLKNLVTKRMNEFLKGAYNEGDVVNVDFGNNIASGTVKEYLGDKNYKVAVSGNVFTVPEINLFKI